MTATLPTMVRERETESGIYLEVEFVNPSHQDIEDAYNNIIKHSKFKSGTKFTIEFSDEVSVRRDRRNTIKANEIAVRLFVSSSGRFAYTFHSRSGYLVSDLEYRKIKKISYRIAKNPDGEREKKIEKILKRRYDETTWSQLNPESLKYQSLTLVNLKSKFPHYVMEELKNAFKEKKDYSYHKYGTKRDLSVSTKMGEDGIFRAWFSSEYAGCGNGQYYLLLSPTTACFGEYD